MSTAILQELAETLSPAQRAAFAVLMEAELARRAGTEADFDATVRARMGMDDWERAILSIPKESFRALFRNAEASVAIRH